MYKLAIYIVIRHMTVMIDKKNCNASSHLFKLTFTTTYISLKTEKTYVFVRVLLQAFSILKKEKI